MVTVSCAAVPANHGGRLSYRGGRRAPVGLLLAGGWVTLRLGVHFRFRAVTGELLVTAVSLSHVAHPVLILVIVL